MLREIRIGRMSPSDTRCLATVYTLKTLNFEYPHSLDRFADDFRRLFADDLSYDSLEKRLQVDKSRYLLNPDAHVENRHLVRNTSAYILGMNPERLIENGGITALVWARLQYAASMKNPFIAAAEKALEKYGINAQHLLHAKTMIDKFHFDEDNRSKVSYTGYKHIHDNVELIRRVLDVVPDLNSRRLTTLHKWWHRVPRREQFTKEAAAMNEISFSAHSAFDVVQDYGKTRYFNEFLYGNDRVRYGVSDAGFVVLTLNSTHNDFKYPIPYAQIALYINHSGMPVVRQVQGNAVERELGKNWVRVSNPVSSLVHGHQILYDLAASVLREIGYPEMGVITSEANQWVGTKKDKKQHMNVSKAVQDYDACPILWGFDDPILSLHEINGARVPVYRVGSLDQVQIVPLARDLVDSKTKELCDAQGLRFQDRGEREHVIINEPSRYE